MQKYAYYPPSPRFYDLNPNIITIFVRFREDIQMMPGHNENTRRIAKNTLMLYFRMLFMMFLGLFTSRIVLESLGETDYGIYNVVGGVVAMFSIISGTLSSSVSRFITFEMGKGSEAQLDKVYSTSVIIQALLAVIVIVFAEPIGLWFIDNKMTIDPARIPAARSVLHFSIFSFAVNLMSIPQTASITAHEKMSAYAYVGILDGILRFSVALLISRSSQDRLVFYAMLMAASVLIVRMVYGWYCRRNFEECHFRPVFDKSLLKQMFSFAGWNFIGETAGVLRDQGGNILINIFFGPVVNAARGVALQLNNVVIGFVTNFMTAVNPQITKSYAAGEYDYMFSLVRKASRMSFYLLFILALPIIFNTEDVLNLWLKQVPDHSSLFMQLFLIFALCESISRPLITTMLASGKIRDYQIAVGGLMLLNLPVSYVLLKNGFIPEITVAVSIVLSLMCLVVRLVMLRRITGFPVGQFMIRVGLNILLVSASAVAVCLPVSLLIPDTFTGFILSACICVTAASMSVLFVGCTRTERRELLGVVLKRFSSR